MGNMTAIIVVCSICGVLIIALLIAFKVIGSRNSKHNLDDQIEKYRKMGAGEAVSANTTTDKTTKKQLKKQKNQQKATMKTEKLQKKLNKTVEIEKLGENSEENQETKTETTNAFQDLVEEHSSPYIAENERFTRKFSQETANRHDRDKEFDDFMNEHSYSRVVANKNLVKQMSKLPNKVKALLLGNVFNKFED